MNRLPLIIVALSMSACFPYNWHERELQKADDATASCREELHETQVSLSVCIGKALPSDAKCKGIK